MRDTCVLWDLDGTLLDTLDDLLDSTNHALRLHGYPEITREKLRQIVGNGAETQIRRSLPEGAPVAPVLADYKAHYAAHCDHKTRPYPHIPSALAALGAKYPMAIVSNKPDPAVKSLCARYFPGIPAFGETPDCPRKPDPALLLRALDVLQGKRCIYVGDSEVDIRTAGNAGAVCLSVTWGFRDRDVLIRSGATHFCEDPAKLPEIIEELIHGK